MTAKHSAEMPRFENSSLARAAFLNRHTLDLMRASAWTTLLKASGRYHPQACRFVAGRRLPSQSQNAFHTSLSRQHEDDPTPSPLLNSQAAEAPQDDNIKQTLTNDLDDQGSGGPEKPPRPKDKSNYGSAARRAGRNIRRPKELPPVLVPPWFLDRNVVLQGAEQFEVAALMPLFVNGPLETGGSSALAASQNIEEHGKDVEQADKRIYCDLPASLDGPEQTYKFEMINRREIRTVARAGLRIPSWQRSDTTSSQKPHFVLLCPKDGASDYLDATVRVLAAENGTDFLRLSPQDIAEIGGDYLDEPSQFRANTISSLGYDALSMSTLQNATPAEDHAEEEDYEEGDEEDGEESGYKPMPSRPPSGATFIAFSALSRHSDILNNLIPAGGSSQQPKQLTIKTSHQQPKDITPELKMGNFIETILNTPEIKRVAPSASKDDSTESTTSDTATTEVNEPEVEEEEASETNGKSDGGRPSKSLILLVQDYPQISNTMNGGRFLDKLHEVVDTRRKEGQPILIIGTSSSKNSMPSLSKHAVKDLQEYPSFGPMRTIVTPVDERSTDSLLDREHASKMKRINIRHIRDMLRRIAPNYSQVQQVVANWGLDVDSKVVFYSGLDESIWSLNRVQRVATAALGVLDESAELTSEHLETALELLETSDSVKIDWVRKEKERRAKQLSVLPGSDVELDSKERIRKLRKTCNDHEKKLLNGVVHPEDIRTTFADVQAPPSTIDALKTLTSLSLVRPDAFKYGVLATDRIPGLLLYGPPGTGKTLLARAVAKESGATVLEVSGSGKFLSSPSIPINTNNKTDVYDMYVGEGEKNVRAIFSLAKKLTPCIVFIDEADAILGARSGGSNRTSHRELINQFLREWDGMTETSAFIMVATNRPFDLDEASLRRLPRRLLVDLPVEKDREAILKIHLKDELLDPEVSLSRLAAETPFYSGSDLKNVAVAAALTCVREEFETAAEHAQSSPDETKYEYAEKRTLHPRHFTKAMAEISASISEDMGCLSAIRKFDEKYGDRRGRRKKGGYGFKTGGESERQGSDAARVRNQS